MSNPPRDFSVELTDLMRAHVRTWEPYGYIIQFDWLFQREAYQAMERILLHKYASANDLSKDLFVESSMHVMVVHERGELFPQYRLIEFRNLFSADVWDHHMKEVSGMAWEKWSKVACDLDERGRLAVLQAVHALRLPIARITDSSACMYELLDRLPLVKLRTNEQVGELDVKAMEGRFRLPTDEQTAAVYTPPAHMWLPNMTEPRDYQMPPVPPHALRLSPQQLQERRTRSALTQAHIEQQRELQASLSPEGRRASNFSSLPTDLASSLPFRQPWLHSFDTLPCSAGSDAAPAVESDASVCPLPLTATGPLDPHGEWTCGACLPTSTELLPVHETSPFAVTRSAEEMEARRQLFDINAQHRHWITQQQQQHARDRQQQIHALTVRLR